MPDDKLTPRDQAWTWLTTEISDERQRVDLLRNGDARGAFRDHETAKQWWLSTAWQHSKTAAQKREQDLAQSQAGAPAPLTGPALAMSQLLSMPGAEFSALPLEERIRIRQEALGVPGNPYQRAGGVAAPEPMRGAVQHYGHANRGRPFASSQDIVQGMFNLAGKYAAIANPEERRAAVQRDFGGRRGNPYRGSR